MYIIYLAFICLTTTIKYNNYTNIKIKYFKSNTYSNSLYSSKTKKKRFFCALSLDNMLHSTIPILITGCQVRMCRITVFFRCRTEFNLNILK